MNNLQLAQINPVDFIELTFGDTLWSKQIEIAESVRDNLRTTVRSCNGIGKSFSAARIALWFLYAFVNSKVITTAPTFRQVEDILWREIRVAKKNAKIKLRGEPLTTELSLSEEWFALGLSTNEPDRFQGFHADYILLIVDEAAGVNEEIFTASEGIVNSAHARILYIGNPTNLAGTFYSSFKSDTYKHIHISAFDTPNFTAFGITLDDIRSNSWQQKITSALPRPYLITPEWVYDKYLHWGEDNPMWQARVLGDFPQQGEDTLIPLSTIEAAVRREIAPLESDPEGIGADIARFGVDKTVFIFRKGPVASDIRELSQLDTMSTANALYNYWGFHPNARPNIDEVGVGGGVVDRIKQLETKKECTGINVGMPAQDTERFVNLRAEIYWSLRERFINGDIVIPNDEELMSQLASIKYKFTSRGQIQLESKEDMKKRGLSSPDKADALAMAFYTNTERPSLLDYLKNG